MIDKEMLEQFRIIMQGMADMESRLNQKIYEAETRINVKLENDISKQLSLLSEGQVGMNEKFQQLDEVAERVEDIQTMVKAMEAVTRTNTADIRELRAVK